MQRTYWLFTAIAHTATTLASQAAADLSDWFRVHVDAADEPDYAPALHWYGLQFSPVEDKTDENKPKPAAGDEEMSAESDARKRWMGISIQDRSGRAIVCRVLRNSPARSAGLNVDDELLAFNRYRVTTSGWQDLLKQYDVGEQVSVLISRRGQLRRVAVTIGEEPPQQWILKSIKEPSEAQQAHLESWLQPLTTD